MSIVIGIDNGISGGLAAISPHGQMMEAIPMPAQRWRNRNEVDMSAVHQWINNVTGGYMRRAVYVIEEPNNSKTPSTAYSVASTFHSFRGYFIAQMLDWHRITPQSWQREMLGKVPKGQTKEYAFTRAFVIWPGERFLATPRCSKPHEGMIDAALIAEYYRRKHADENTI